MEIIPAELDHLANREGGSFSSLEAENCGFPDI